MFKMFKKNKKCLVKTTLVLITIGLFAALSCTMLTDSKSSNGKSKETNSLGLRAADDMGIFNIFNFSDVSDEWKDIIYAKNAENRIVIADMQNFKGEDTCNIRFDYDHDDGRTREHLACKIEEEQTHDSETAHAAVKISGLFADAEEVGTNGVVSGGKIYDIKGKYIGHACYTNVTQSSKNDTFTLIVSRELVREFPPVVFANVRTYNGHDPVHVRILNVEYVRDWVITYKLEEWENGYDGAHTYPERVDFLILKQGIHTIGYMDSMPVLFEVGIVTPKDTNINWADEKNWTNVDLITEFLFNPAVITRTQTYIGTDQCVTRNNVEDNSSFKTIIQEEEARSENSDFMHAQEQIGYLAFGLVDKSNGRFSTIVQDNGSLNVGNYFNLKNENNQKIQLKGVSAFWMNWDDGKKFANDDVIGWLIYDWKINVYRAALGVRPIDPNGTGELMDSSGFVDKPVENMKTLETVIRSCIRRGIYVIIDWHVHDALDPTNAAYAEDFFSLISQKYGMYDNIIYEIWNEPGWPGHIRFPGLDPDTDDKYIPRYAEDEGRPYNWSDIKPYCINIINIIRKNDYDNIIICPSPVWDQWIDEVAAAPITQSDNVNDTKIMYSFHFYAGSHVIDAYPDGKNYCPASLVADWTGGDNHMSWYEAYYQAWYHLTPGGQETPRADFAGMDPLWPNLYRLLWQWNFDPWLRLKDNVNAVPIFVTEWGTTTYDGGNSATSTAIYETSSNEWLDYLDSHNMSWCAWSISDKAEGSATLKAGASTSGGWSESDLTPNGVYLRKKLRGETTTIDMTQTGTKYRIDLSNGPVTVNMPVTPSLFHIDQVNNKIFNVKVVYGAPRQNDYITGPSYYTQLQDSQLNLTSTMVLYDNGGEGKIIDVRYDH